MDMAGVVVLMSSALLRCDKDKEDELFVVVDVVVAGQSEVLGAGC
jgi:hypothetical protein